MGYALHGLRTLGTWAIADGGRELRRENVVDKGEGSGLADKRQEYLLLHCCPRLANAGRHVRWYTCTRNRSLANMRTLAFRTCLLPVGREKRFTAV